MPMLLTKLMAAGLGAGLSNAFCADTADNQTATGTNQATAFETSTAFVRFITVASGTGCLLDNGARGDSQYIINAGANTLLVYPHVGGTINQLSANAAFSIPAGSWAAFDRYTDALWTADNDAASTSFVQSGTGAVSTDLQSRGRKVLITGDHSTTAQIVTEAATRHAASTVAPTAQILRLYDRVFVGKAIEFGGTTLSLPDSGSSWLTSSANGASFLPTNGTLVVMTNLCKYGIVGAAKSSLSNGDVIGIAGAVINDKASAVGWALYADLQHESGANQTIGVEIAGKNKGSDVTMTPNAQTAGVFGVWLAGGGDNSYGGSAANPSNAGVAIVKNASTWNTGIVVMKDALTAGRAMALSSEGTGGAHFLGWYDSSGNESLVVQSSATGAVTWKLLNSSNGFDLMRAGKTMLNVGSSVTVANGFQIFAHSAGNAPQLNAYGDDTDITFQLGSKGAGDIYLNPNTGDIKWGKALVALGGGAAPTVGTIGGSGPATAAQNSWLRLKDSAGNACWVPVWK
jgi:hypothetical protein